MPELKEVEKKKKKPCDIPKGTGASLKWLPLAWTGTIREHSNKEAELVEQRGFLGQLNSSVCNGGYVMKQSRIRHLKICYVGTLFWIQVTWETTGVGRDSLTLFVTFKVSNKSLTWTYLPVPGR